LSLSSVLLLVYIGIRIICVDITNDEAYSFYIMKNFWYAEALCTGNTHWLNSFAMGTAILFGFENPFAIRWLSLLAFAIFLSCTLRMLRTSDNIFFVILLFCLLALNPYVLDYFTVARGYASGLALQMVSILCFMNSSIYGSKTRRISLLVAGLTPFANYSFIYFFIAFASVYFIRAFRNETTILFKKVTFYAEILFVVTITAFVLFAFRFIARCSGDVFGAGTTSLRNWLEVLPAGLINNHSKWTDQPALIIVIHLFMISSAIYGILKKNAFPLYNYCSWILLIMLAALLFNFFACGVVLPYYRSALFLFPCSVICSVFFLDHLLQRNVLTKMLMLLLSFLLITNFFFHLNISSVRDYKTQSDAKETFDLLEEAGAKNVVIDPELFGVYRNYYAIAKNYSYSFSGKRLEKNDVIEGPCYLVLAPPYKFNLKMWNSTKITALHYFYGTGTVVLKIRKEIIPASR
jgi:hypothetical protein